MSRTTGCRIVVIFGVISCFLVISLMVAIEVSKRRAAAERRRQWVAERKQMLLSGRTDKLYFYDEDRTDELLAEFAGMPEITKLAFELTDLTDAGVQSILQLPNLKELKLEGGREPIGDEDLATLSACKNLETLKLINTRVTDDGLRALRDMPSLNHLTIYRDPRPITYLTDGAATELRELHNLETLAIGGGWMSKAAITELRKALPNCKLTGNGQEVP